MVHKHAYIHPHRFNSLTHTHTHTHTHAHTHTLTHTCTHTHTHTHSFNVYTAQPVIKSGSVLRRANVAVLEREKLVTQVGRPLCF